MEKQQICTSLEEIFFRDFCIDKEELTPEKTLQSDLGVDSLDRVHLTVQCEEIFKIQISDKDSLGLETYGELVNLVERSIIARN